jgi:hypothetical protein
MGKPEELVGRKVSRLQDVTTRYAAEKVKSLSREEVLAALSVQGVDSLESLVDKALDAARLELGLGGGQVAKDTFLFTQFIYRTEGPGLPDDILAEVASKIGQVR